MDYLVYQEIPRHTHVFVDFGKFVVDFETFLVVQDGDGKCFRVLESEVLCVMQCGCVRLLSPAVTR